MALRGYEMLQEFIGLLSYPALSRENGINVHASLDTLATVHYKMQNHIPRTRVIPCSQVARRRLLHFISRGTSVEALVPRVLGGRKHH
jgi:hypothetical protein